MTPPICMRTQYNAPYRLDDFEHDDDLSIPDDLVARLRSVEGAIDPEYELTTDLRAECLPAGCAHAGRADIPPVWPAPFSMAGSLLHRLREAARRYPLRRASPFLKGTLKCAGFCLFATLFATLFALCLAAPLALLLLLGQELAQ